MWFEPSKTEATATVHKRQYAWRKVRTKNNSLHYILPNEMAYLGNESYNSA
jgi:hypothetical protein